MSVSDRWIEMKVSTLLKLGVLIAGSVTLAGGILFLLRHGGEHVSYTVFQSQPRADRFIPEILSGALHGRARSVIQLGVLLLIATPVARVAFSLVGFAFERDRKFVVITAIVLAILLFSLINGALTS